MFIFYSFGSSQFEVFDKMPKAKINTPPPLLSNFGQLKKKDLEECCIQDRNLMMNLSTLAQKIYYPEKLKELGELKVPVVKEGKEIPNQVKPRLFV